MFRNQVMYRRGCIKFLIKCQRVLLLYTALHSALAVSSDTIKLDTSLWAAYRSTTRTSSHGAHKAEFTRSSMQWRR